ncbi:MAG: hypothetical protein KF832_11760 [Caldilineaceae bacterium]|nr:hypothetical protein [Caldilineaceae bacterium]
MLIITNPLTAANANAATPIRIMTYTIENMSLNWITAMIINEYPSGRGPVNINFSVNYPDLNNFELLEFTWKGSGNCTKRDQQNWSCSGNISYLKFSIRYSFAADLLGQQLVFPVKAFEDGTAFSLGVIYPSPLEFISSSNPPTTVASHQLEWTVASLQSFEAILTLRDPRISTLYLPIAKS